MIDITIWDMTVKVEMKRHYMDYDKMESNVNGLEQALLDIIERVKYSGETISLWRIKDGEKHFVKEWH